MEDIKKDQLSAYTDLANLISAVNNPESATKAVPDAKRLYARLVELAAEKKVADRNVTPEEEKRLETTYGIKISSQQGTLDMAPNTLGQLIKPPPADLIAAVTAGKEALTAAEAAVDNSGPVDIVASQPEGGAWMMWVLILFVIAACAGFLFQDGIWGNCLRLVNVLFAGLLAMNFYEPVARFMTEPGKTADFLKYDDLHTFTAFWDFLAFWICFIFFAAILIAVTDQVSRVRVRFLQVAERAGGVILSLIIGWVMSGIVLTSLHLAPLGEYPFLGCFQPQSSMFLGFLAPDREWLGFTRYQSKFGYCRPVSGFEFPDSGDQNFIDKHHKRRIEIERYVRGNNDHSLRVNPQFIHKAGANPAPPPGR
jgi:hypothetical protein